MAEEEKKSSNLENIYALKAIPLELRKPWTYHAAAWAGVVFVLAAFMGGATPITLLPYGLAIVTIIIGNLILFGIFVLTSYLGSKSGMTTYLLAERAFGSYGARILINLVVAGIPAFAWYGIETWLAAAAIAVLAGWDIGGPGRLMDLPTALFTMISGIVMAIPPILGITSIAYIDYVAVPVMAGLVVYGLYLGITAGVSGLLEYTPPSYTPENAIINFMIALNVVIGLIIVGATIGADTARWIKPVKRNVIVACLLGFFATAVAMEIIGTFFAVAAVKAGLDPSLAWNIVLVLKQLGVATGPLWPLLIGAWLLQFTTNIVNAYSGGLALTASIGRASLRPWLTLAGAIIGSIVAVLGIVWFWIPYLTSLANWISPVAAILLTEYYLIRKLEIKGEETVPRIRIEGLIGWFIGGLVAYILTNYAPYFVPAIIGMIISAIIHLAGGTMKRKGRFR